MRDFLLLQLIFNVLILVSLMVLARGAAPARRRRRPASDAADRPPAAAPAPPAPVPSPADHLSKLIERTEREELVAEAALRERLSRFRTRVAG
ncbi:MAG: hypothetical protein Q9Q40_08575 [Acidobacteriota bacterium]|nr:hypothetical protein [Acidobacteriota bacterium]MDQ7088968.1 hypothetical protein [Acidobacteriota bacterium]